MSTVRDKFEHYHFKMTTLAATTASLSSNTPIEFLTTRVSSGEHVVEDDSIFKGMDLLDVYNSVVFRKTGDLQSRAKQFIKCYLAIVSTSIAVQLTFLKKLRNFISRIFLI